MYTQYSDTQAQTHSNQRHMTQFVSGFPTFSHAHHGTLPNAGCCNSPSHIHLHVKEGQIQAIFLYQKACVLNSTSTYTSGVQKPSLASVPKVIQDSGKRKVNNESKGNREQGKKTSSPVPTCNLGYKSQAQRWSFISAGYHRVHSDSSLYIKVHSGTANLEFPWD